MENGTPLHKRRSIRLKGYDYSQPGAYFVTICTHNRELMLGEIVGEGMVLNDKGIIVETVWNELPNHYSGIELNEFVVMPNHIHGIIMLVGAGFKPAPTRQPGLPEIIRAFKTFSSRRINQDRRLSGIPCWQRNYYERVIRNENELNRAREYIINNPCHWALDAEFRQANPSGGSGLQVHTFTRRGD